MTRPNPKSPRQAKSRKRRDYCSDDEFHRKFRDEDAARSWFAGIYWPNGVRCPTCRCCDVTELGTPSGRNATHRCNHCQRDFSLATGTLLDGLDVSYRQWLWALHIFTGSAEVPTPKRLAAEVGWNFSTARDATYRLLQATKEPPVRLSEPSELDWAFLHHPGTDGLPGKSLVIALVGRRSRRVAGLQHIQDESKPTIRKFVKQHLVEGMTLFADTHRSNQEIPKTVQYFVKHDKGQYTKGPASINRTEGLWPRVKSVLHTDYSWYQDHCLGHWLDGVRWGENHGDLTHPDRVKALALAMRWKTPKVTQDHYAIQQTMDQELRRKCEDCKDCRNVVCLVEANTPMDRRPLPRADSYSIRRIV